MIKGEVRYSTEFDCLVDEDRQVVSVADVNKLLAIQKAAESLLEIEFAAVLYPTFSGEKSKRVDEAMIRLKEASTDYKGE